MGLSDSSMLLIPIVFGLGLLLVPSTTALLCLHNTDTTKDTEWDIQECDAWNNETSCLAQYRLYNNELLPSFFGCHTTDRPCDPSCNVTEGQSNDFSCCCSSDLCNMDPIKNNLRYASQFQLLHDHDCNHSCIHLQGHPPQCYCNHGYNLSADGKTCVDLDECAHNNGGCQGVCHNEEGTGYHCSCPPDKLLRDKFYCDDYTGPVCYNQTCTGDGCTEKKAQQCRRSYSNHCQATYKVNENNEFEVRLLSCFSGPFSCEKGGCTLRDVGVDSIYHCCCDGQFCNGNITMPVISP